MPRSQYRHEVLTEPNRAVFAAAKNYKVGKSTRGGGSKRNGEDWQENCWAFYDTIGEYRYSVNWVGNLLSRAKLVVTKDGSPVKEGPAAEALASLFGGPEGQGEMLRQLGINFTVAGEAFIAGVDGESSDDWFVVASTEVSRSAGVTKLWGDTELADGKHVLMRLWRPHPRKFKKSDAPSRAVLPILSEIDQLTKHVAAQIDSRLAGAGLLLLPSEISFSSSPSEQTEDGEEVATEDDGADAFVKELTEVMSTAIQDRADASALVPIVLQVAGEYLDKVQHLTFSSELDEKAIELRTEAIRRLALGMDMPPEILTGSSDLNHWTGWQVEEAAIKSHSEPLLAVITSSLTSGYLHPFLEASGVPKSEIESFSFDADTSEMRLRPNRSKEAIELYDRGELSGDAMLRENGFVASDAMGEKERKMWFIRKIASGSTTPEQVEAALAEMGIDLRTISDVEPTEARPTRSLEEHPSRDIPDEPDEGALLAASEQMVFRALERAGNRVKNKMNGKIESPGPAADLYLRLPELSSSDIDDLLLNAWENVGRFDYGVEEEDLRRVLQEYTVSLITLRKPFDRDALRAHLDTLSAK